MKLIVGLGNPGEKYEGTRHNAGFLFLDQLVCNKELAPIGECVSFNREEKFDALLAFSQKDGEKLIFVKPQTYMNLSGGSVAKIMSYWKADASDIIVISDDVDLPVGSARVRNDGSSGGQKGLQNIIDMIGTDQFTRIRIGIKSIGGSAEFTENMDKIDTADFVLSKFEKRELPLVDEIIGHTIEYILPFIGTKSEIPSHSLEVRMDSL